MKNKKLKSLKVLLVEDEQNIAQLLKSALGGNFRSFLLAKDGDEGYELFMKTKPDIIITDIMMPRSTGLEMANKIRTLNKEIPIIILSAYSEKEKLFGAIDAGVTKYFTKPYDPDEILQYIISIEDALGEKIVHFHGGFSFNRNTASLYKNDKYIALNKKEVRLIELFLEADEMRLDYEVLKENLWDGELASDERLRTFIKRFREKTSKSLLITLKGIGYQLNEN